jgi:hypothetical protein
MHTVRITAAFDLEKVEFLKRVHILYLVGASLTLSLLSRWSICSKRLVVSLLAFDSSTEFHWTRPPIRRTSLLSLAARWKNGRIDILPL